MSSAGNFEITVSHPYPVWCDLVRNGVSIARFSHKELSDLHYAVEKAMQEARIILPKEDRHEV